MSASDEPVMPGATCLNCGAVRTGPHCSACGQRVLDLEQRLEAGRTQIETWELEVDRALGLR